MRFDSDPIERFAEAAHRFCSWGTSETSRPGDELALLCRLVADLVAAGSALGWEEGEPSEATYDPAGREAIKRKASELPFQYYAEVFNTLVLPAEEPVTGNLVDDLQDIYADVAPGLTIYRSGRREEAADHWKFWFAAHWGEHATSALRATWSYLAERDGSDAQNQS